MRGDAALAAQCVAAQQRSGAAWSVDHGISEGDEAVIEWTMRFRDPRTDTSGRVRGAEWFRFQDGKIAEIRPYDHPGAAIAELQGFPYGQRGYTS